MLLWQTVVLADRGFPIQKDLLYKMAKLLISSDAE